MAAESTAPQEHLGDGLRWPQGQQAGRAHPGLARVATWPWTQLALVAVAALAALVRLLWIDQQGYANTYYAAGVKSMLTSWQALFFGSFDPTGYVTIDKPPAGFWLQALSAKLLGFDGVSLVLPQAIAGIASVLLLYHLIRQPFGPGAGLFAALALAVTPVAVATDRNNTPDALVVFVMLGAIWATARALQSGQTRWLLVAAALVGLGFNIKMMQAYLVLPALVLTYGLMAQVPWRKRLADLVAAAVTLLVVSFSWSLVVDLTPASERPFVGSSGTNSALSLALGYNGLGRLAKWLGLEMGTVNVFGLTLDLAEAPGFAPGIGTPGLFRLFTPELAGQVSWLLPLALFGVAVGGWWLLKGHARFALGAGRNVVQQRQTIFLWICFLLTQILFFDVADFFHTYYLITLGPAIAAMAAIAVVLLWRLYQTGGRNRVWLPLALVTSALAQVAMVAPYPEWDVWLRPLLLGGVVLAVLGFILPQRPRLAKSVLVASLLLLLAAPATWSAIAVQEGAGGTWLPYAGPSAMGSFNAQRGAFEGEAPFAGAEPGTRRGGIAMTYSGPDWDVLDLQLLGYLEAQQGAARYLVATETSSLASVIMLATDQPAMALGGYQGWDEVLSPEQLAKLVGQGDVRFFLISDANATGPFAGGTDVNTDLLEWVRATCTQVPETAWRDAGTPQDATSLTQGGAPGQTDEPQGSARNIGFGGEQQLYDCAP